MERGNRYSFIYRAHIFPAGSKTKLGISLTQARFPHVCTPAVTSLIRVRFVPLSKANPFSHSSRFLSLLFQMAALEGEVKDLKRTIGGHEFDRKVSQSESVKAQKVRERQHLHNQPLFSQRQVRKLT